jgi:hypothetical protein
MTGGSRIIAFGSGSHEAEPEHVEVAQAGQDPLVLDELYEEAEKPTKPLINWVLPTFAALTAVCWTAFFGWANREAMLAGATPLQWIDWIKDWAVPVLLICTIWLLAMRNSRREAARFGDTARLLRDESAALETRLTTMNQELSLAREFIASQSRDLESLGRIAAERLSQNADRLQSLVRDNSAQVEAIATVSASALENMDRLRGQLPVIASSAKDVTNNIANAGRVAYAHLEDMVNGFKRINEFGQASERQVISLRGKIDTALAEFTAQLDQISEVTGGRFIALAERGSEFRTQLESYEIDALAAIRSRAKALADELEETRKQLDGHEAESLTSLRARLNGLRDESTALTRALRDGESAALKNWNAAIERLEADMRSAIGTLEEVDQHAMESARARLQALVEEASRLEAGLDERRRNYAEEMERRQQLADTRQSEAIARLSGEFAAFDADLAKRRSGHEEDSRKLVAHSQAIASQLDGFAGKLREVTSYGSEAESGIAASLQVLADKLVASREALSGTDKAVAALTENSIRLLELIQATSQHSREEIPGAIAISENRLTALETRVFALRDAVTEADQRGAALSNYVITAHDNLGASLGQLDQLHSAIGARAAEHGSSLSTLRQSLESIKADSASIAEKAQGELRNSIAELTASAADAVAGIETMSASAITAVAERLGEESSAAIDRVLRARASEAAEQLEHAAANAAGISREAAIQLRDQLAKVNELAGNLEQRVNQARERAEEQVDNDFSRRVALITESLNSNAIDIAKALSTDVTDTAWAAYLRGDRGVFTRRAVRLLDSGEAKAVAQIYESERDFREHVSHYIHDFEAMLRQLLSTRDGHALGVTLLSSDMGKLYVALAQSIERLRA